MMHPIGSWDMVMNHPSEAAIAENAGTFRHAYRMGSDHWFALEAWCRENATGRYATARGHVWLDSDEDMRRFEEAHAAILYPALFRYSLLASSLASRRGVVAVVPSGEPTGETADGRPLPTVHVLAEPSAAAVPTQTRPAAPSSPASAAATVPGVSPTRVRCA